MELTAEEKAVLTEAADYEDEPEATEEDKKKLEFHKEMLESLKAEKVDAALIARSIKKLLDSNDVADVRAGVSAYTKIMIEESKERKKKTATGIKETRYRLDLPKKEE